MLKKILVGITSSDPNHYVFDQALMLAKVTGAHLGLLYVTDPDESDESSEREILKGLEPYLSGDESDPVCYAGHFETIELTLFGKLVARATGEGVSTDCIHCFGDPERAINDLASVWTADLIVLGRRGRSGMAEFFLGSVSNYTFHHAPCSVYVVHEASGTHSKNSSEHETALEQEITTPSKTS
jgi:nucleotide-binding universal stress UspA family protein